MKKKKKRQRANQPASHPARPFCTGSSIGNQVDGLPIDLSYKFKAWAEVAERSITSASPRDVRVLNSSK